MYTPFVVSQFNVIDFDSLSSLPGHPRFIDTISFPPLSKDLLYSTFLALAMFLERLVPLLPSGVTGDCPLVVSLQRDSGSDGLCVSWIRQIHPFLFE